MSDTRADETGRVGAGGRGEQGEGREGDQREAGGGHGRYGTMTPLSAERLPP